MIKEMFLKLNIPTQVIDAEKMKTQQRKVKVSGYKNFIYTLQNMGVAICAKLGGSPWLLDEAGKKELIIGIGASPFMRMDAAMFGLIGYLLMSIHTFSSATVFGEFRLSYLAGGPTELRILLIIMTLFMFYMGYQPVLDWPWGGVPMSHFDLFAIGMGALLTTIFTVQTFRTGMALRKIGG